MIFGRKSNTAVLIPFKQGGVFQYLAGGKTTYSEQVLIPFKQGGVFQCTVGSGDVNVEVS